MSRTPVNDKARQQKSKRRKHKKMSDFKIGLVIILVLSITRIFGQPLNNIWYFGDGNTLDFSGGGDPVIGERGVEIATPMSTFCREGTSVISDDLGNLLFYTDGIKVWDREDNEMPNGFGLLGTQTSAQVLIVPNPDDVNIYYIFHMDYAAEDPSSGLRYTEVDMTLNGGYGDVTASKNVILIDEAVAEQLKAITHCNGNDIWVLTHMANGNEFNAFLVTGAGVDPIPVSTSIGSFYEDDFAGMSFMTCSKDGSKIATCPSNLSPKLNLITFNNLTGTLCDPEEIEIAETIFGSYGVEFSADASKVYVSGYHLQQYDVETDSWYIYPGLEEAGGLMRGPNDEIYIAGGCDYYDEPEDILYTSRFIHAIHAPNEAGAASLLETSAFITPRECGLGLGTYYYPTQTTNTCDPLNAEFTTESLTICVDDCIDYENLSTGTGITDYEWMFEGGSPAIFTGSIPPTICYDTEGTYITTLTLTDCAGETTTYELTIVVTSCNVDFESDNTTLCVGECVNFTDLTVLDDIVSWDWEFPGAVTETSTEENPALICYETAGSFDVVLTVTDIDGNIFDRTIADYIIVEACIPPQALFAIPDTICVGSCIDLHDESLNDPSSWLWTFDGATPESSTEQNPTDICFNAIGNYEITLSCSNEYGEDEETKTIVVMPAPFAGTDVVQTFCDEISIVPIFDLLLDESSTDGVWYGLPSNTVIPEPFNVDPSITNYYYILSNTYDGMTCSDTAFLETTLEYSPQISLGRDLELCANSEFLLVPEVNNGDNIVWHDGSTDVAFSYTPELSDIGKTLNFSASTTNDCGTDSDDILITIIDCEVYVFVPNAFTPDGNDINNLFHPFIQANNLSNFEFTIYNRWGETLFKSYNPEFYWTGEYGHNGLIADGIYIWKMKFNYTLAGQKQIYSNTGHITILR